MSKCFSLRRAEQVYENIETTTDTNNEPRNDNNNKDKTDTTRTTSQTDTIVTTTTSQTDVLYQDILEDLTGRARREAEISASMASLDQTPTYTVHPTMTLHDNNNTKDTSTNSYNNNNSNDSTNGGKEDGEYKKWGLPLKESLFFTKS